MSKLTKSIIDQNGKLHEVAERNVVKSFANIGREQFGEGFTAGPVLEEISKAVATNSIGNFGSLQPMLLENLDATMTSVLFNKRHLKLYNSIPRIPSAQTLYQWT